MTRSNFIVYGQKLAPCPPIFGHEDVAKMCANVHKLYTPSMTTLDTLLEN